MPLNKKYWNLWKQSEEGKAAIKLFEEAGDGKTIVELFEEYPTAFDAIEAAEYVYNLLDFTTKPILPEELPDDQAEDFFGKIADEGITMTFEDREEEIRDTSDMLFEIPVISTWLYLSYPDLYKPYFFQNQFYLLTRIAESFDIKLPSVPLKSKKIERLKYYADICKSFSDFQAKHGMTAAEFCGFLYDFAPNDIKQNNPVIQEVLPEPTQVWMIGANKAGGDFEFLDNFSNDDTHFWQGNEDTKKGDILVMYCLAPYSCIHSIWRATTDGITDPFFHWYGSVYIGEGQKITPITLNELKSDHYFSQHALVRKNLQGVNGYPLTSEAYLQLQKMIVNNGGEVAHLPKLYGYQFDKNKSLNSEEEVNVYLVEPLFIKLGYTPNDWKKESRVSMGRGEGKSADYAFPMKGDKNGENVSMLVESKKHINTKRDMDDAFRQVKSYGKRLLAKVLVIADKDFIWIYQRQKDYDFDSTQYVKKA
ncbi:type I restriction enzyme HsdR N-terminal domain-containing protein [Spirosoma spitsbergense]|uniref:type I restriction enzyme HsdR N-terminal domain-containing protein n=1 Tax=Spirosoma spitsbergense TaxID=431554 RepID=UPI00038082E5|nr:type I restriction enzyme HsdR N-terminal domain-containing protein [Spirosoma spitsbergense]